MKSKIKSTKGKKVGGKKKKGGGEKKPPQQAPRGDEKPGFVLPEAERAWYAGFGCMVTKTWVDAKLKKHAPLMLEIARTNMQRHWDKVTDAQSKASLLLMLGYSLVYLLEEDAMKEGQKYMVEAMELIRSLGERSAFDIVFGVWPEECYRCWRTSISQADPSERNGEVECLLEMIKLTRRMINAVLKTYADDPKVIEDMERYSHMHYTTELNAIEDLSVSCYCFSEEDTERLLVIFEKRLKEIETVFEREGWDLNRVRAAKASLIGQKCRLYVKQGKLELAMEIAREDSELIDLHISLCLASGRIEEAVKSMEKYLSTFRSNKTMAVEQFGYFLGFVVVELRSLFKELVPKYPHVLWAASSAGFVELSKEENKTLRCQLEAKKALYCVNCSKEMTKVYRCSRCELATYCGTTCQKEAWKEHKKICKKRE
jgi:hypothetical protein